MRTAVICPTCATFENALCIIYNGEYLAQINVNPLEDLGTILGKINETFSDRLPLSGEGIPNFNAEYIGQTYLNTETNVQYQAKSVGNGLLDWKVVLLVPTTGTPEYADNNAAIAAGLNPGNIYRTGDILKIVH